MVRQAANCHIDLYHVLCSKPLNICPNKMFVSPQFSSVVIVLSNTHSEQVHVKQ